MRQHKEAEIFMLLFTLLSRLYISDAEYPLRSKVPTFIKTLFIKLRGPLYLAIGSPSKSMNPPRGSRHSLSKLGLSGAEAIRFLVSPENPETTLPFILSTAQKNQDGDIKVATLARVYTDWVEITALWLTENHKLLQMELNMACPSRGDAQFRPLLALYEDVKLLNITLGNNKRFKGSFVLPPHAHIRGESPTESKLVPTPPSVQTIPEKITTLRKIRSRCMEFLFG
jgi:hypothetical protein